MKICSRKDCPLAGRAQDLSAFGRRADSRDGYAGMCKACNRARVRAQNHDRRGADFEIDVVEPPDNRRAARIASDFEALKPEDYDTSVGNDGRIDPKAAREKRQEYSQAMGEFADAHRTRAPLTKRQGEYIAGLAEQERRFGNRRLARSVSIAAAHQELARELFKQTVDTYFRGKIVPTGYALKGPGAPMPRTMCQLFTDDHLGAQMDARGNPIPFRAVEEARRLEYFVRQGLDYKPDHREETEALLLIAGDNIDGNLQHDQRAGIPVTEQKAVFWHLFGTAIGLYAQQFKRVRVVMVPGNHGRDIARHPGRATEDKWDGHEWEMFYALRAMCSGLPNVEFDLPFRPLAIVDLHGANLLLTHADTEVKLGHPDTKAKENAAVLDQINATRLYGCEFAAMACGHHHTPRYVPKTIKQIFNGALVPANGYARTSGYNGELCGHFMWEAVEGYPVGDLRFVEIGVAQDRDERLGTILTPFRFTM
jgi:hypothetical protein